MYVVKYIKSKYFDNAIDGKDIRIGTFNYFKIVEDNNLRDEEEGAGKLIIQGNNFKTDLLRDILPTELPSNFLVKFEAGQGRLIDDISMNMFVYCATCVNNLDEIDVIREKCFPDKDRHFFISNEHLFETRCGEYFLRYIKGKRPEEPVYKYCFTGKVDYTDLPKETLIKYEEIEKGGYKLRINLSFLFEKPTRCRDDNEFRLVWFFTNKSLDEDYRLYSISDYYCDVTIDPTNCISKEPVEFLPSEKSISVWDLNK